MIEHVLMFARFCDLEQCDLPNSTFCHWWLAFSRACVQSLLSGAKSRKRERYQVLTGLQLHYGPVTHDDRFLSEFEAEFVLQTKLSVSIIFNHGSLF